MYVSEAVACFARSRIISYMYMIFFFSGTFGREFGEIFLSVHLAPHPHTKKLATLLDMPLVNAHAQN